MIRPSLPSPGSIALAASLLSLIAGCGVFKGDLDTQKTLNERVVGRSVGDFFQTYGNWRQRVEQLDGTTEYEWFSPRGEVPNKGFYGLDDRVCRLHLVAARNGRIAVATVVQDAPGRTSPSRCNELFIAG